MVKRSQPNQAYAAIIAGAISLNTFWIANICKESFGNFKSFLNFYNPVGPLLGLFVLVISVFIVACVLISLLVKKPFSLQAQKTSIWLLIISTILFFVMVFPPVFEPIADFIR